LNGLVPGRVLGLPLASIPLFFGLAFGPLLGSARRIKAIVLVALVEEETGVIITLVVTRCLLGQ
jgi:hypothetical protein